MHRLPRVPCSAMRPRPRTTRQCAPARRAAAKVLATSVLATSVLAGWMVGGLTMGSTLVGPGLIDAGALAQGQAATGGPGKTGADPTGAGEIGAAKSASGNTGTVRGSPSSLLGTPLLSPARVPRALQAFSAEQRLDGTVAAAMSPQALGKTAAAGSCAEIVQDGHVLYQDHPGLPVVPASNMKLLTATALLDKFGPSFRFQTSIMVTHKPTKGVVHGDLYFVGGGDPLLRLRSYAASVPGDTVYTNMTGLVLELKAAGVRQVTGSVVGDASELDSLTTVPGWPARYVEDGDVGALSALGIDDGFATAGGQVPIGAPVPVQSAGVLTNLLRSAHISVQGQPSEGKAPRGAQLFVNIKSAPLGSVLGEVLRESDNTAMELMTKGLGRHETRGGLHRRRPRSGAQSPGGRRPPAARVRQR